MGTGGIPYCVLGAVEADAVAFWAKVEAAAFGHLNNLGFRGGV
jgi:hypothetical protein